MALLLTWTAEQTNEHDQRMDMGHEHYSCSACDHRTSTLVVLQFALEASGATPQQVAEGSRDAPFFLDEGSKKKKYFGEGYTNINHGDAESPGIEKSVF